MKRCSYFRPRSLDELWELKEAWPDAGYVAGGTDTLFANRRRPAGGAQTYISLRSLPELCRIEWDESGLRIGSGVTIQALIDHPGLGRSYPALVEAGRTLGSQQIRNVATLGGNLCNASPAADMAPPLLVHEARLVLRSPGGCREIPVEELFLGPGKTALAGLEILEAVLIEPATPGARSMFLGSGRVRMDIARASVAVLVERAGTRCTKVRLAAGAVAPTPLRLRTVEGLLEGAEITSDLLARAQEMARSSVAPITDLRAHADYRRQLVGVFVKRAMEQLTSTVEEAEGPVPSSGGAPEVETSLIPTSPAPREVTFVLNGAQTAIDSVNTPRLLDALRGPLRLTGTKEGCGEGQCGACTVLLDGRAVLSCLHPTQEIEGREVTTIEGLVAPDNALSPVQRAFAEHGGIQCGFCSPGMVLAATALLGANPDPTEEQIRTALHGNLCRCTGYVQIVESVKKARMYLPA